MGTSFGLLKTTVLPWRRAASSLSISSKAAAGRAWAGRLAWRMAHGAWRMAHGTWHMAHGTWHMAHGTWHMAHGKSIIGTANGAPPGSSQGSESGAATRVGRRPGHEWAWPPSATGHPLSLIWVSPDLPPKI